MLVIKVTVTTKLFMHIVPLVLIVRYITMHNLKLWHLKRKMWFLQKMQLPC